MKTFVCVDVPDFSFFEEWGFLEFLDVIWSVLRFSSSPFQWGVKHWACTLERPGLQFPGTVCTTYVVGGSAWMAESVISLFLIVDITSQLIKRVRPFLSGTGKEGTCEGMQSWNVVLQDWQCCCYDLSLVNSSSLDSTAKNEAWSLVPSWDVMAASLPLTNDFSWIMCAISGWRHFKPFGSKPWGETWDSFYVVGWGELQFSRIHRQDVQITRLSVGICSTSLSTGCGSQKIDGKKKMCSKDMHAK